MQDQGDLAKVPFPVLLASHFRSRSNGALLISVGTQKKRVYLRGGAVVFASSEDKNDRLGEMLLRRGALPLPDYLGASAAMVPGKRFGTVLVERGILTPSQLVWAVKEQVKQMVFALFGLPAGACSFAPDVDAGEEMITLAINTPELIRQGVACMDNIVWPLAAFRSPDAALRLAVPEEQAAGLFELSPDERAVLAALASPSTLGHLCVDSRLPHFALLKLLWSLLILDLIQVVPVGPEAADPAQNGEEIELGITGDDLDSLR